MLPLAASMETWACSSVGLQSPDCHDRSVGKHKLQKDFRTDGNALLVNAQMQEMEMVRQKVYQLEQTQIAIKQK